MTGKMDRLKNFKVDDDFERYLSHLLMTTDYNLSQIIRQAILIAGPFIQQHPECAKSIGIPEYGKQ